MTAGFYLNLLQKYQPVPQRITQPALHLRNKLKQYNEEGMAVPMPGEG